jgi:hypothetical protein
MTDPKIVLAVQVDLRTGGYRGTLVCPGSNNAWCTVDGNLVACREPIVRSIIATNQSGIVSVGADTAASHGVGISVDSRSCRKQRSNKAGTHREGQGKILVGWGTRVRRHEVKSRKGKSL